jgi:hypothetical protein
MTFLDANRVATPDQAKEHVSLDTALKTAPIVTPRKDP